MNLSKIFLFLSLTFVVIQSAHAEIIFSTSPYRQIQYFCPDKPNFLNISSATWCNIHKATHNAIIAEKLDEKLGYEKALSVMLGLIQKESSFKADAIGKAGEIGLAQIMPSTGRFICHMKPSELKNIDSNLNCSAKYLNLLLSENFFDGDLHSSLMAYNQGWGNIKKGIYFENDIRYARLIMSEYSPKFQNLMASKS